MSKRTIDFISLILTALLVFVLFARINKAYTAQTYAYSENTILKLPFNDICSEADESGCLNFWPRPTSYNFIQTFNNLTKDYCLNIPVLLYHYIEPYSLATAKGHAQLTVDSIAFDNHLKYLSENGYTTLSALDLVNALRFKQKLPKKSIVITIDDGYEDVYTYAFQSAKKYNAILNIMIPTGLLERKGYVSWQQLSEMKNSGLVNVYNHTYSHFPLSHGDRQKAESEILLAEKDLETHLDPTDKILTYPYGDFDEKTIDILRSNDYLGAFTTRHGRTQCLSGIYELHRDHVGSAPLNFYGL